MLNIRLTEHEASQVILALETASDLARSQGEREHARALRNLAVIIRTERTRNHREER